jgi:hypothetical protein
MKKNLFFSFGPSPSAEVRPCPLISFARPLLHCSRPQPRPRFRPNNSPHRFPSAAVTDRRVSLVISYLLSCPSWTRARTRVPAASTLCAPLARTPRQPPPRPHKRSSPHARSPIPRHHCPSHRNRARPAAATVADSPDEDAAGASHHHHGTRDTVPTLRRPVASPSYPWSAAAHTATKPATAAVRRRFRQPPSVSDQGEQALATPSASSPFSPTHPRPSSPRTSAPPLTRAGGSSCPLFQSKEEEGVRLCT